MTRNNVSDNFEACYLRENPARRAFANEEANAMLADREFQKCSKHIANLTFQANKHTLTRYGFDFDDMLSIVQILGLQFLNSEFDGKTKKDYYYVMMHGINQKLANFYDFLDRKFRIRENHLDLSLDEVYDSFLKDGKDYPIEAPIPLAEESTPEPGWVRKARRQQLRAILEENLDDYRDKLSELATLKLTEYDIRKKARSICKKHGIDYIGWAKSQIKERNLSTHDFVLD